MTSRASWSVAAPIRNLPGQLVVEAIGTRDILAHYGGLSVSLTTVEYSHNRHTVALETYLTRQSPTLSLYSGGSNPFRYSMSPSPDTANRSTALWTRSESCLESFFRSDRAWRVQSMVLFCPTGNSL